MDSDKIKRTYYLEPDTVKTLNTFVTSYCADVTSGSTYGAHSSVVNNAINFYTSNYIADQSFGVAPSEEFTTKMKFKVIEDDRE